MMKEKFLRLTRALSFRIVAAIVIVMVAFSVILGVVGYTQFSRSMTTEYTDSTYRVALTASVFVNGDEIDDYLATGGTSPSCQATARTLDILCQTQDVNYIYVIKPSEDYTHYTFIFDAVNRNSDSSAIKIGTVQETTNAEYVEIYRQMYEEGREQATVVRTENVRSGIPHINLLLPVRDTNGRVRAILVVYKDMVELKEGRTRLLSKIILAAGLSVALACTFAALYFRREFAAPVTKIAQETKRFAQENTLGHAPSLDHISSITEIQTLASSIRKMEEDTVQNIENLTVATSEKQRISTELALAAKIQNDMLPNVFPAFPDRTDFDVFAMMTPAKEVGGDFYDFFLIDDDHLGLVMADVSGKGIPAALFMMMSKMLIQNYAMTGKSPKEILKMVNDKICANNREEMFVTVWFGILDLMTGKLTAANAGHEKPIIKKPDGDFTFFRDRHGFVIGGMEGMKYKDYEIEMEPGAKIFLYTDGLPDATYDFDGDETYGFDRMVSALNLVKDETPEAILKSVHRAVDAYVGGASQFDDLTMLCLQYNGRTDEITLPAVFDSIGRLIVYVGHRIKPFRPTERTVSQIEIAIDEIFSNIARYAYPKKKGKATVRVETIGRTLVLTFMDSGIPYDPTAKSDPDTSLPVEERPIGGVGIFLVKKMMDAVEYRYEDGHNILTLKKTL